MLRRQQRRARGGLIMISDKVRPHHLQRKAILYVRQSSTHQVLHNRESSALQYAMRDRLMALGWREKMTILAAPPRAESHAPASSGWWQRCASARSAASRRARSRALPATAGTVSS